VKEMDIASISAVVAAIGVCGLKFNLKSSHCEG